ncbi:MAG: TldD/PmbA family protein [Candidatus Lokiarchaeota archaeon]|nr:TldD/PmbA family protein [Candidatus Lokiarchaeota archaeon]
MISNQLNLLSKEEIIQKFENFSGNFSRKNQYFDILYDSYESLRILKTRSEESIVSSQNSGAAARTYVGYWREYSFQDQSGLLDLMKKIPSVSDKGDLIQEFEGWKTDTTIKLKIDPSTVPLEEKVERVRELFTFFQKFDERIINPAVSYAEHLMKRIFVNNEGSILSQTIPRVRLFLQPIAKEGATVDFDYFSTGGEMGYEIFDEVMKLDLEQIANNSLDMLKADHCPAGMLPLILDPDMTGLVAHESFGHGLEADQVLRDRSYLKAYLNKKVASEICVICDSPAVPNKLGSYFFDDEGIKSEKTTLVKDGILKNFLHDRMTSSKLKAKPGGNGRRESFQHPVLVRMTNTFFESGDHKLEEMIETIDRGVMLVRGYFGMEDPLGGGMQCSSKKGYLIEKGEKTKLLKSITLSGSVLEFLQDIDAISKDEAFFHAGTCGKGEFDFVPVTSGGPYIRAKKGLISPG